MANSTSANEKRERDSPSRTRGAPKPVRYENCCVDRLEQCRCRLGVAEGVRILREEHTLHDAAAWVCRGSFVRTFAFWRE